MKIGQLIKGLQKLEKKFGSNTIVYTTGEYNNDSELFDLEPVWLRYTEDGLVCNGKEYLAGTIVLTDVDSIENGVF
jgi:hypothetical protein